MPHAPSQQIQVEATALIVEDSQTQAQIIGKMIEAQGWSFFHCGTIREASESLAAMSVQAIFLDVFVGAYNGLLHIDRFRKLAPGAPLILMTAGSAKEAIEETLKAARRSGADYVLKKPFNETILRHIFETAYKDVSSRTRRRHVLVIDDSQTIRSVVSGFFEAAAYRVSQAATMEEAFENVDIAHIDLVLCDVFMPGMGGLKGMRTIKQTWPKVKVIAMSAGLEARVSETDALNATRKIGADAQLIKPFTAETLKEVVDALWEEDIDQNIVEV